MKKKIIITFACLLIFSGCGFKVVNNQKLHNFSIINVNTTGDNKIAYYLKNNLEEKKEIKNRKIDLDIKIRKDKTIKEKNIKNQITKYQILLRLDISYTTNENNMNGSFSITRLGNYTVEEQYSQTINNENNLMDTLNDNLAEEIKEKLSVITNDF